MLLLVALTTSAFASVNELVNDSDLSYLENFQVENGDLIFTVLDFGENDEVYYRIYLNEDRCSTDYFCNRIYRVIGDGKLNEVSLEIVREYFEDLDEFDYVRGIVIDGKDLIRGIKLDLRLFPGIEPGVKIDSDGYMYYGYSVTEDEIYDVQEKVVDYLAEI